MHGRALVVLKSAAEPLIYSSTHLSDLNLSMRFSACSKRFGGSRPVGETKKQPFQLSFDLSLKVDFQVSRVTSDGGLILVRELDERLGFSELIRQYLTDSRAKNTQLPLADLLRRSIYSRMTGYENVNDAERLSQDPTFRLSGSEKYLRTRGSVDLTIAVVRD